MSFNPATNFGLMIPAAVTNYSALLGQIFQPLSYQQVLSIAVSTSYDRNGRHPFAYLGAVPGDD